ncbi:MAG: PIG-L family deacetylase [Gammaproteobacteria bacterium]|nr:PIG-L family deacetylase [Gammaproteobacteria bacterium]
MLDLGIANVQGLQRLLCIGAHCDDIEIGCGGTVLTLLEHRPELEIDWVVFSSDAVRAREAAASAADFLGPGSHRRVRVLDYRNGYFPSMVDSIKDYFERLKHDVSPDLVLTHHRGDFHQDHRTLAELSWNTFRNHCILEYEIPKFDGDLGRPNAYVALSDAVMRRKVDLILRHFGSQAGKQWWTASTFEALMRLRGVECNSPGGYAEAFFGQKLLLLR